MTAVTAGVLQHRRELDALHGQMADLGSVLEQVLAGRVGFWELMERARPDTGSLRLLHGMATLRATIVARLSDELASLAETEDAYERLDAFGGFRMALGQAVSNARAGGLRPLGKALMVVRDAVSPLKAEELEDIHFAALQRVLDRLASRDPSQADLVAIDTELLEVGLDWVPVVPSQEEDG